MEHVLRAIRADEAGVPRVVCPEDVVVREQMLEPELLHRLRVLAHAAGVGADLRLRKDRAELQRSTRDPPTMASRPSANRTHALPLPS